MRNLSYHVHKEVPGADKYQELDAGQTTGTGGSQKKKKDDAGCFGGKKAKGMCCKKLRTGNGFGGHVAVQSCSCKHLHRARLGWCSLCSVCSVLACVSLPCYCWMFGILFSTIAVILFGFKQECCMLTADTAVGKRWMCSASPLPCCVLLSPLAWLCSMCALLGEPGQHGPTHPSIPVHGTPACTASLPPDSHT